MKTKNKNGKNEEKIKKNYLQQVCFSLLYGWPISLHPFVIRSLRYSALRYCRSVRKSAPLLPPEAKFRATRLEFKELAMYYTI